MTSIVSMFSAAPHSADTYRPGKSMTKDPELSLVTPEHTTHPTGKSGKIVLPTMEGLCFEKTRNITYLEAQGNYTMLHFEDARQILVCKTLRDVEMLLPKGAFVRIHRSHTVHLKHLKKYVRGKGGHVILQNGVTLAVSTGQKDAFLEAIKNHFS